MLLLDETVEIMAEALDSDAIKTTHFDVDKDQMDVSSTGAANLPEIADLLKFNSATEIVSFILTSRKTMKMSMIDSLLEKILGT
jgi:hypothetical protein